MLRDHERGSQGWKKRNVRIVSYSFQNVMLRESLKTNVQRGESNVLEISTNYKKYSSGKYSSVVDALL